MTAPVNGLDVPAHVLVTGASSGIGLSMVDALLENPAVARVCAVSRRAGDSDALALLQARHGARLQPVSADLTTDAGLDAIVAGVGVVLGVISIVTSIRKREPISEAVIAIIIGLAVIVFVLNTFGTFGILTE